MDKGVTAGILITLVFSFVTTGYAQKVDRAISLKDYQVFQTPVLLRLSNQTHLSGTTDTESRKQKGERPPLSAIKITGEVLTGGVAAAVGTFLMRQWIAPEEGEEWSDNFGLFVLLASFAAGGLVNCVSSATGVYIVGNTDNETASFETTLEGSILGLFAGWAIFPLCAGKSTDGARFFAGLAAFAAGPPIGATIGFNMTRRHKIPPASSDTGLVNFRDGQMSLAIPRVYLRPDSFGKGGLSQSMDLLRVGF